MMPLRFQALLDVVSLGETPRQPVPDEFAVPSDDAAAAYFRWLRDRAEAIRPAFIEARDGSGFGTVRPSG